VSSVIVQKSHRLNNIHLRFSAQDRNRYFPLSAVPTLFAYSRHALFSVATKLTILNYDLSDIVAILSIPIFHTLRALAVVDYPNGFLLLHAHTGASLSASNGVWFDVQECIRSRLYGF
jgi:hypothetical protein